LARRPSYERINPINFMLTRNTFTEINIENVSSNIGPEIITGIWI